MARQFKFDRGDWIATQSRYGARAGEWRIAGKVVDADSESITVERRDGTRDHFVVGEDLIARVQWRGRGRWTI